MSAAHAAHWDEHSRELTLTLDREGKVLESDARARRLLTLNPDQTMRDVVLPGTEQKLETLLRRAAEELVLDWELSLIVEGRPSTIAVSAKPGAEGTIHLLGHLLAPGYKVVLGQLNDAMDEVLALNRTLARQRGELSAKNSELTQAYRSLDESNRGVVTLHTELGHKADALQHAADIKGRVLANVSHEFRTPLHTILGLSRLLLDDSVEHLTDEQRKQVEFIRSSAEELSHLVNDLLDLSKVESGTAQLRPERFSAADLLASLRGQLRPLLQRESEVALVFDEAPSGLTLDTDRYKVTQVVRNLVSNALKFTETGEVRFSMASEEGWVSICVRDTGIGIAPWDYERIFEEFGQVESHLQAKARGTGLGLPLSRKLAALLGGSLTFESEVDKGSTFTLRIPVAHPEARELERIAKQPIDPARAPVLVVEDDRKTIFVYEKYLSLAGFQVVPARSIEDARQVLERLRPAAIVLDIMLEGEVSWGFLAQVKQDPRTQDIPVLVVTVTNKEHKARALGADEFWLKPVDQDQLLRKLKSLSELSAPAKVLVIDDDERARYLLRKYLERSPYQVLEASNGADGIACARERRPAVILLDFLLQEGTAFDVLDELKGDPRTRGIPVVIVTSHMLDPAARMRLSSETETILSKESLSREVAISRIRDALRKAGVAEQPRQETAR